MNLASESKKSDRLTYSWRHHCLLVTLVTFALFAKNAPLFLAGQFVSEDSFYFYETAYNSSLLGSLTTPYAGYLHVIPMFLAELLWHAPFAILPWVNHAVALTLCVVMLSWLYTPYCRRLIPSDTLRAAAVLLLALTPFQPNLGMLLGLHWYLSFMMGLILLGELPKDRWRISLFSIFAILTAWSAPATIALIPIAFIRWIYLRKSPARLIPLCFTAASTAYTLAVGFIFKPNSEQPGFAELSTALHGFYFMLYEGLLARSVVGSGLIDSLPSIFHLALVLGLLTLSLGLLWQQRMSQRSWVALLLFAIACLMLILTMLRGHQSAFILKTESIDSAIRYLSTPTFYFWTALLILLAPIIERFRVISTLSGLSLLFLLNWGAPPLSGSLPLNECFPHAEKAKVFEQYQDRIAQGKQAETLALPGWTPYECMRLQIGGGRDCKQTPLNLESLFGDELQLLGENRYQVEWFGRFSKIDEDWITHSELGKIALLGYQKGFYWLQKPDGQRYLTGPAIHPHILTYPPENMQWIGHLK